MPRLTKENLDALRVRRDAGDIATVYLRDLLDTIDALEADQTARDSAQCALGSAMMQRQAANVGKEAASRIGGGAAGIFTEQSILALSPGQKAFDDYVVTMFRKPNGCFSDRVFKEVLVPANCDVPGHFKFQENGGHCMPCQNFEASVAERVKAAVLAEFESVSILVPDSGPKRIAYNERLTAHRAALRSSGEAGEEKK
jgi:hypothetical protein